MKKYTYRIKDGIDAHGIFHQLGLPHDSHGPTGMGWFEPNSDDYTQTIVTSLSPEEVKGVLEPRIPKVKIELQVFLGWRKI